MCLLKKKEKKRKKTFLFCAFNAATSEHPERGAASSPGLSESPPHAGWIRRQGFHNPVRPAVRLHQRESDQ